MLEAGRLRSFEVEKGWEKFLPFLNREGLTPENAARLEKILREFYEMTFPAKIWFPRKCHWIPQFQSFLAIASDGINSDTLSGDGHFWYELILNQQDETAKVVIDPTGLPKNGEIILFDNTPSPDNYQPYFGRRENAPLFHKTIYAKGHSWLAPKGLERIFALS